MYVPTLIAFLRTGVCWGEGLGESGSVHFLSVCPLNHSVVGVHCLLVAGAHSVLPPAGPVLLLSQWFPGTHIISGINARNLKKKLLTRRICTQGDAVGGVFLLKTSAISPEASTDRTRQAAQGAVTPRFNPWCLAIMLMKHTQYSSVYHLLLHTFSSTVTHTKQIKAKFVIGTYSKLINSHKWLQIVILSMVRKPLNSERRATVCTVGMAYITFFLATL